MDSRPSNPARTVSKVRIINESTNRKEKVGDITVSCQKLIDSIGLRKKRFSKNPKLNDNNIL